MIDGRPLIDVHLHTARRNTLKMPESLWDAGFDATAGVYDGDEIVPAAFDAYLEAEGVDIAILFCEYSPLTTGMQLIEHNLPIVEHNPARYRLMANINPHLHGPPIPELERQMALGAGVGVGVAGLKLHPVHARFAPNDAVLWPLYAHCQAIGLPVVIHCGTSNFPGAVNRYADPGLVDEVAGAFPDLTLVLAHGGRGWWYEAAGFVTLLRDNVWIEISGLPPKKLPGYYRSFDLARLGRKFIFGSDWPGLPSIARNAAAVADLGFDDDTLEGIYWRNAASVYRLGELPFRTS